MWTNYIRRKTGKYQSTIDDWLKMPVGEKGGVVEDDEGNILSHRHYANYFISTIESILQGNNYIIKDKNEFKKDIYRFIYTLSDNCTNGNL